MQMILGRHKSEQTPGRKRLDEGVHFAKPKAHDSSLGVSASLVAPRLECPQILARESASAADRVPFGAAVPMRVVL